MAQHPSHDYDVDPFCYICSGHFDGTPMDFRRAITAEAARTALFHSALSVEGVYALSFSGWRTLYRIVMYNPEVQAYQLSGVARKPLPKAWWHKKPRYQRVRCIAPQDEHDAVLEARQAEELHPDRLVTPKLIRIDDDMEKQATLAGYLVHALCWREFLRLNNRSNSEGDLSLISQALRRRCLRQRLYVDRKFYVPIRGLINCKDSIATTSIRQLVKESRSRASRGARMPVGSRAIDSRITRLPPELQCMILDLLHYNDIIQVLRTLKWTMHPGYWRGRLDVHFFTEIQFLSGEKDLDWQWLCLKLEELKDSQAGKNRTKFFDLLKEAGDRYGITGKVSEPARFGITI
ncbi:hypothetical protein ASPBRDRAFT_138615 [Aspergillus brasiliensis CBS 101740]|uniref:F-box domain-containing protein n=1 Tax=Aspergillus brasiliensis (strain CBS 101740 / IMI 381727 / IBT 21946) TaxID=767769 RepID=A0A1L9U3A8_ASPBC|nr:hypothetical protein ASPBRDRAFT_138615 [Aspergillus brasiliensis CBS 101740]